MQYLYGTEESMTRPEVALGLDWNGQEERMNVCAYRMAVNVFEKTTLYRYVGTQSRYVGALYTGPMQQ